MSADPGFPATLRYEVLPFPKALEQARSLPIPLALTVTCSPKHGPDHGLDFAAQLRELGHSVTLHIAARMVRDGDHLDALLQRMAQLGILDAFLVGGDTAEPAGPYPSALPLLAAVHAHPLRPAQVGVAAYPEGHPLIRETVLDADLAEKAQLADYIATQLCFDPDTLAGWLARQRARGVNLPLWIGLPGQISATKLLEISARIGVGPSIAFLRKQNGLRGVVDLLRTRHGDGTEQLFRRVPAIAAADGAVAGLHLFTFNELEATRTWCLGHRLPERVA